uniref:Inner centromere protein A n=1 Tax=Angiostrongylus cantonensis TaxID=6313 RepID=A0A0K0DGG2_ANGCA
MTDRYDSLYDTVNARRFGSLRNDDSVTETMCDAFFKTRSSLEDITKSVQGALNAVGDQPVQSDKAIERDLPVSQDQNAEGTNGMIPTRSAEVENQAQDLQRGEESENCPKSSIVAKPVGKLVSVSHAKSVQQSKPPRVMQLAAPERNVVPMSASRPRATALQKNTPIAKHRAPAEKDRGDHNKDLRSDIRKMRLSTDRQARDRTPRSNVSSAAAAKKMQHSAAPRMILAQDLFSQKHKIIHLDSFLKNDVVPSEREFRHELNNRNPSLGSVRRGLSSTPKSETKEPQSDDLARTSVSRDHQIHGPMNTLKPQASTVSRAATGTPVASNTLQSKTRSSSATRTLDRPLNIARSTVQRANVKHCGNDARSSSQSSARPSRANCLTIVPQNVNRPNFSKPSRNQPATAQAVVPVKENALLASVKPASTQRSSVAKAAPVGTEPSSARRLSRNELRAMVERLAVPKRVAATAMRTPLRIRNEQTHGVRCVKIRSRSSSLSRHPVSAQDNIGGVPAARTLLFSTDENPRCVSVEPGTQQELH